MALQPKAPGGSAGGTGFPRRGDYRAYPWRPNFVFQDSPTCLNFKNLEEHRPRAECPLIDLVPEERSEAPPGMICIPGGAFILGNPHSFSLEGSIPLPEHLTQLRNSQDERLAVGRASRKLDAAATENKEAARGLSFNEQSRTLRIGGRRGYTGQPLHGDV